MTTPPDSDWLEDLLKEEPAYIDDAGFSQKIVAQLPQPTRAIWVRRLIFSVVACLALVAIFLSAPALRSVLPFLTPSVTIKIGLDTLLYVFLGFVAVFISSSLLWVSREK